MKRLLVLALLSAGCLTRTDLGRERFDAGCDRCDAGADAAADALGTFVRDLSDGRWRGTAEAPGFTSVNVEVTFHLDGRYVARCLDDPDPDCMPFPLGAAQNGQPGQYWITDLTANGEFWGRTLDSFRGQALEGELDHMRIRGDELRFVLKQRLDVLELTAAVLVLERAR